MGVLMQKRMVTWTLSPGIAASADGQLGYACPATAETHTEHILSDISKVIASRRIIRLSASHPSFSQFHLLHCQNIFL